MSSVDGCLNMGLVNSRGAGFDGFLGHVVVLLPNLPSETGAFFCKCEEAWTFLTLSPG